MKKSDIKKVLATREIIIDTREQKSQHVEKFLDSTNIPWKREKLDSCDYSIRLPDYPELDNLVLVERKMSLDEICGNFTKGRERFTKEFERIDKNASVHLVVEKANWYDIIKGNYRSRLPSKSLIASIMSFSERYNIKVWFCKRIEAPRIIDNLLYYAMYNKLKNIEFKG